MWLKKTCVSCAHKLASSYAEVCVECLKKDSVECRFPNWKEEEKSEETRELDR